METDLSIPAGYGNTKFLTYKYANGVIMTEEPFNDQMTKGVKFWGNKGWTEVQGTLYCSRRQSLTEMREETGGAYETQILSGKFYQVG